MKIEKEFKIFGDIEYLQTLLYDSGFRNPCDVLHSNMHFTHNGKTVKLRIEYNVNRTGFGLRFSKITKEDINSKDLIKPKTENETRLTPTQFIEEFKKYSKNVKSKNIVFYTLVKERFTSTDKRYKNITVDVCEFAKWPVDINRFGLADILTKYPDLVPFINRLNKSSAKLILAQPYIEIESLSKNMTTSKLVDIVTKEIFEDEDIFITNKSAATLTKIFQGQFNTLRVKSEIKPDKKEAKENNKSEKSDETVRKKIIDSEDNNSGLKRLLNEKFGETSYEAFKDRGGVLPTDFEGDLINVIPLNTNKVDIISPIQEKVKNEENTGNIIKTTVEKSRGNFDNSYIDTDELKKKYVKNFFNPNSQLIVGKPLLNPCNKQNDLPADYILNTDSNIVIIKVPKSLLDNYNDETVQHLVSALKFQFRIPDTKSIVIAGV